ELAEAARRVAQSAQRLPVRRPGLPRPAPGGAAARLPHRPRRRQPARPPGPGADGEQPGRQGVRDDHLPAQGVAARDGAVGLGGRAVDGRTAAAAGGRAGRGRHPGPGPAVFRRLRHLGRGGPRPQRAEAGIDLARPEPRMSALFAKPRAALAKRLIGGSASMNRRDFLRLSLASTGGAGLLAPRLWGFEPVSVANPLAVYANRGWEEVSRDQYRVDGWFPWVCAPNDTHNCLLRAYVRNGVVLRSESGYECGRVKDLYGHSSTAHWNPRSCSKGESQQR